MDAGMKVTNLRLYSWRNSRTRWGRRRQRRLYRRMLTVCLRAASAGIGELEGFIRIVARVHASRGTVAIHWWRKRRTRWGRRQRRIVALWAASAVLGGTFSIRPAVQTQVHASRAIAATPFRAAGAVRHARRICKGSAVIGEP